MTIVRQTAVVIMTLTACFSASAQLTNWYNAARQRAQQSGGNPTNRIAAGGETWVTFCEVLVPKGGNHATEYYSPVFAYPYPGTQKVLFDQVIPSWQAYVKEHYPGAYVSKASCETGGGPTAQYSQTLEKRRKQAIDINREYHKNTDPPVAEADWTFDGATALSAPISSEDQTSPSSAPRQAAPTASHKMSAGTFYCSTDMRQYTIYFSSAFNAPASTYDDIAGPWRNFLKQRYGYQSTAQQMPACFGGGPDLEPTRATEQKRIDAMKHSGKWHVVETGWTPKTK